MGILKDHYLMFCNDKFDDQEFSNWVLRLDQSDLKLILETWN
jgi:hypothetical protein